MNESDRTQEELQALGEERADSRELATATLGFEANGGPGSDADEDLQVVAALFRVSEPVDDSELATQASERAWAKIEARLAPGKQDDARRRAGRGGVWAAIVTFAAAAAVAALWIPRGRSPDDVDALGEQARLGLRALGVEAGREAADAEALADRYEAALAHDRGLEW